MKTLQNNSNNESKKVQLDGPKGKVNQVNNNLPEWIKAGATVYSTKMWMHGDPFTIDGESAYCDGCMVMTAPNGFGFNIKPEEIAEEFAPVAPAPVDKQGNTVPESDLHIGERVILGDFFKTDEPNTEGTICGKEWDEKACAWSYRIRVAECVYYWGRADQVTRKGDTFFDEQSGKAERETASAITEAEGVKVGDKVRHNKHEEVATVTAIREAFVNRADGYRYLFTLDFGQEVFGPFHVDLNGGEFLREAFTLYEKTA